MEEEWKDVPGYEGFYQASSLGRVKCVNKRNHGRKKECSGILFQSVTHHGYRRTTLQRIGKKKNIFVQEIIALTFIGPRPIGLQINHIDKDRANNRSDNLEYVTSKQNIQHSRHGKIRGYRKNKWGFSVYIWINNTNKCLGTYKKEEDAQEVYRNKYFEINGFYPW